MPGSPPTSPRFGAPRYADTDTAAFSTQVNGVTDDFDAAVARRLVPVIATVNTTAADHNVVIASASTTITLPVPSSEHQLVAVYAKDDASGVSGAAPVTITANTGAKIFGVGLGTSGVSSIVLGTPGAYVWLFSHDGTNWKIVKGQQDTGWVALTLSSGVIAATGAYVPSVRLLGDAVKLKGIMQNNTGSSIQSGTTWATIPGGSRPAAIVTFTCGTNSAVTLASVTTSGSLSASASIAANGTLDLDGTSFSLN